MKKYIVPLFISGFIVGCSSVPTETESNVPVETRNSSSVSPVTAGNLDASGLPRELTDPKSVLSKRSIYFDLDKYEVKAEYHDVLNAHAKYLNNNKGFKVLLQGNTDERGSSEYNLSLGQKRSEAVKKSLTILGVKEDQLESVSLGKEKPKNAGHDEAAWAENRRADILYRSPEGKGEF